MSNYFSNFLFASPSFLKGIASSLDIGSTLIHYNEAPDEVYADTMALTMDWCAVGQDMKDSMAYYDK